MLNNSAEQQEAVEQTSGNRVFGALSSSAGQQDILVPN